MKKWIVNFVLLFLVFAGGSIAYGSQTIFQIDDSWQNLGIDLVGFDFRVSGDIDAAASAFNLPDDWDTSGIIGGVFPLENDNWLALSIGFTPLSVGQGMVWEVKSGDLELLDWSFGDDAATSYTSANASVTYDSESNTYTFSAIESAAGISRTGFWVVPGEEMGSAIVIEIQDGHLAIGWGAYDAETGKSAWIFSDGPMSDENNYSGDLLQFSNGACFDCQYVKPQIEIIGPISIQFTSDTTAILQAFSSSKIIQKSVF